MREECVFVYFQTNNLRCVCVCVCVNRKSVHSAGDWRGSNPREHHPTTEGGVCCQRGECV